MKKHVRPLAVRTCVYFTLAASVYSALILVLYASSPSGANISAQRLFLLLPFSFCLGAAEEIRRTSIPQGGRIFLHALLSILGTFLFLVLPATYDRDGQEKLTGFILTLAAYAVAVGIRAIVSGRLSKLKRDSEKYRGDGKEKR